MLGVLRQLPHGRPAAATSQPEVRPTKTPTGCPDLSAALDTQPYAREELLVRPTQAAPPRLGPVPADRPSRQSFSSLATTTAASFSEDPVIERDRGPPVRWAAASDFVTSGAR